MQIEVENRVALLPPDQFGERQDLTIREHTAPASSLATALAVSRRETQLDSMAKTRSAEELATSLATAHRDKAPPVIGQLGTVAPWLGGHEGCCFGIGGSADSLHISFPSFELSKKMLAVAMAHPRRFQGFTAMLDKLWADRHATIEHDSAEPLDGGGEPFGAVCWKWGVCLCSPAGKLVQTMMISWWASVSPGRFRQNNPGRALLGDGKLVCRIEGEAPDGSDAADGCLEQSDFWHVAFMNWSPRNAVFIRLEIEDASSDQEWVKLRSTMTTKSELEVFERLDKSWTWVSSFYLIEETEHPALDLRPGVVGAVLWGDGVPVPFWPRPKRRAPARSARGRGAHHVPIPDDSDGEIDPDENIDGFSDGDSRGDDDDEQPGIGELEQWLLDAFEAADDVEEHHEPEPALLGKEASDDERSLYAPTSPAESVALPESEPAPEPKTPPTGQPPASSDEVPMSLPPPAPPGHESDRRRADIVIEIPDGGTISYYGTTARFVAVCRNREHGDRCIKTRTATASARGLATPQGRPLGHLVAWLFASTDHHTKDQHFRHEPEFPTRAAARLCLETLPRSEDLLMHERPIHDGESNEPMGLA